MDLRQAPLVTEVKLTKVPPPWADEDDEDEDEDDDDDDDEEEEEEEGPPRSTQEELLPTPRGWRARTLPCGASALGYTRRLGGGCAAKRCGRAGALCSAGIAAAEAKAARNAAAARPGDEVGRGDDAPQGEAKGPELEAEFRQHRHELHEGS